jgi:hypothetical protein
MNSDNRSTHSLAVAALVVGCVSLLLTLLLAGFLMIRSGGERAAETALPTYLSEKALADIAESIAKPFNAEDFEALYGRFDPVARAQLSADTLKKQLGVLRPAIGKIDDSNFVGGQRIASPGTLPMYQLQYALKLSGGEYTGGTMTVKVMDHGDHAGIIWFFVGGTTPK